MVIREKTGTDSSDRGLHQEPESSESPKYYNRSAPAPASQATGPTSRNLKRNGRKAKAGQPGQKSAPMSANADQLIQ
jgi:hypothetical protein